MAVSSITSAAPSFDLTTAATVVADMEMTCGAKELRSLERIITAVSSQIANYCHRVFAEERITMLLSGYASTNLLLDRMPIVEVLSVAYDGEPITDHQVIERNAGMLYRAGGWTWTTGGFGGQFSGGSPRVAHPNPNSEEALFTVDAWAGYILPSFPSSYTPNASSVNLPPEIEEAALIAVKDRFAARAGGTRGIRGEVTSVKTTGVAVSYAARNASAIATQARLSTGLPLEAVALLEPYVVIK